MIQLRLAQTLRLLAGLLSSCALASSLAPLPAAGQAIPREPSATPGINAEFKKPNVDVQQWVERFEREGREIYTQRKEILRAAKIKQGSTVADIGAGTGLFTLLFAEAVGPAGQVIAVEIVPDFLRHIERRAAQAGYSNVQTVLGTERSVELPPNSIDLAFICDTYHHFEYPTNTLASLRRALRPGGHLFLIEFKRIPGQSSDWILKHVRAGQEVFTAEIEAAGFRQVKQFDFLKDNYVVRFRKKAAPRER
jgi:predicted methyltransferase